MKLLFENWRKYLADDLEGQKQVATDLQEPQFYKYRDPSVWTGSKLEPSDERSITKGAGSYFDLGRTLKKVFAIIFGSFFSNIMERDSFDSLDTTDTDLVLSVNLEKFEYLTPQLASNDKFSIWIKYTIDMDHIYNRYGSYIRQNFFPYQ